MPTRIRYRTDNPHAAEMASRRARGLPVPACGCGRSDCWSVSAAFLNTPPAEPGDCWQLRWLGTIEQRERGESGAGAGYALCCPKCLAVHYWTIALNCGQPKHDCSYVDDAGVRHDFQTDFHSGNGSCWTWSGSPEDGTLSASPSLHSVIEKGGCGYHGHLQTGVLSDG